MMAKCCNTTRPRDEIVGCILSELKTSWITLGFLQYARALSAPNVSSPTRALMMLPVLITFTCGTLARQVMEMSEVLERTMVVSTGQS